MAKLPGKHYKAAISQWTTFTPTGLFTNTTYTARWRRVGSMMEIHYRTICTGTPAATIFAISMPVGFLIDSAALLQTGTNKLAETLVGSGTALDDSASKKYPLVAQFHDTSTIRLADASSISNNEGLVQASTPFSFAVSDIMDFTAVVPIAGWSSKDLLVASA